MFGREGEQLENLRRQRRAQYATDLQQQMGDRSTFRSSGAQQIVGFRQPDQRQSQSLMATSGYSDMQQGSHDGGNQKMEFLMERMLAFELPLKMKPIQDSINGLTSKIENISNSNQMAISSMKDKVTEINFNINSINEKAAENKEKVQHMINDLYQNTQRTRDFAENTASRVAALESRFAQLEDMLRAMSDKQQQFEQNITDQLNKLNAGLQTTAQTSAENDHKLATQMESLNRETQATFGAMGRQIQTVSAVMTDAMNQLATSTRDSLDIIRSDNDDAIANIERQLEQATSDTAQALNQLERDVIDTFSTTMGLVNSSHAALESAIMGESAVRKRNDEKMLESYGVFTVAIAGQVSNNTKSIERIDENVKSRVEQVTSSFLSTWKTDLSEYLRDVSDTIGDCQTRTTAMEHQLTEYVKAISKRQDEIMSRVDPNAKLDEITIPTETPTPSKKTPKLSKMQQTSYRPPLVHPSLGELPTFQSKPASEPKEEPAPAAAPVEADVEPEVDLDLDGEQPVGLQEDPPVETETPTEATAEIPYDERPIRPMKSDQIPEFEDEVDGDGMQIVSNGMVFRRKPQNEGNGQAVAVYVAEPRSSKKGMGLALHGRYHQGRHHRSKRDSMRRDEEYTSADASPSPPPRRQPPARRQPPPPPADEPSVDFSVFNDEPSLAECAFIKDEAYGGASQRKRQPRRATRKRA